MNFASTVEDLKDLLKDPLISRPLGQVISADVQIGEQALYIFEGHPLLIIQKMPVVSQFFKNNVESSKVTINANPTSGAMEVGFDYNKSSKPFHDYMWSLHFFREMAEGFEGNKRNDINKALTEGQLVIYSTNGNLDAHVKQTMSRFGIEANIEKTSEFIETKDERTERPMTKQGYRIKILNEDSINKLLDIGEICLDMIRGKGIGK